MMSESDDTDVLLLIPPDLFLVPSSDSEDSEYRTDRTGYGLGGPATSVVTELFDQVQSLENRMSVIESKDTSLDASFLNNSTDAQFRTTNPNLGSSGSKQQQRGQLASSRNRFSSVSQISSLLNTPTKPRQFSSVPSTPSNCRSVNFNGQNCCDTRSLRFSATGNRANAFEADHANSIHVNKLDELTSYSEPSIVRHSSSYDVGNMGIPHALVDSDNKETRSASHARSNDTSKRNMINKQDDRMFFSLPSANPQGFNTIGCRQSVKEMELSEVDELLHEMENTESQIARRSNDRTLYQIQQGETSGFHSFDKNDSRFKRPDVVEVNNSSPARRLDFNYHDTNPLNPISTQVLSATSRNKSSTVSVPFDEDSLYLDETDKMISDFKIWRKNSCKTQQAQGETNQVIDNRNDHRTLYDESKAQTRNALLSRSVDASQKLIISDRSVADVINGDNAHLHACSDHDNLIADSNLRSDISEAHTLVHSTHLESGQTQIAQVHKNSYRTGNLLDCTNNDGHVVQDLGNTNRITNDAATNTESSRILPHRLLTLSDFWETDPSKSHEDMLRIKLEEEKFRRDHCEHLIQELQKRLLEQQEKVAVAVRVDNEKNVVIMRLQNAWTKLKLRWQVLEAESNDLQLTLKNLKDKHQIEDTELQSQIKRCEGELSKALDLAAGYKEKSDKMTEEKLESLKSHADELENYKSLVQEAETRYSQLKVEYNKVLNQNQQLGEALKNTQQEVNRERLRGSEVRGEMGVIHKALDACEAELIILRQEKESLQLKLKEEVNRNHILEQNKSSFLAVIDEAKNAERTALEEAKSHAAQQEKMRIELREVYQKQVDEVVKAKLHEFQSQLDTAESAFQSELESRQRAIAECAARKIKTVLDKHQLEISLLEEKHKEEKRLWEIQLAQSMQQVSMLDAKLNTQQTKKTQLAEQLHSVMQRQWQQALQIISGGSVDNPMPVQRNQAEKLFESKNLTKSESSPNVRSNILEPMRLESHSMPMIDAKTFSSARISVVRDGANSAEETPLTSRRDQSKDDLRKYIKMILDMQQPKSNFTQSSGPELSQSPKPISREVPRKHYMKQEESFLSEDSSVIWQPSSEISAQEATDYISFPQKLATRGDHQKIKPPWK